MRHTFLSPLAVAIALFAVGLLEASCTRFTRTSGAELSDPMIRPTLNDSIEGAPSAPIGRRPVIRRTPRAAHDIAQAPGHPPAAQLSVQPVAAGQPQTISADHELIQGLPLLKKEMRWVLNEGPQRKFEIEQGEVTYYKLHNITASGVQYDHRVLAAAHRTLPFGTVVRCTRTDNNKSVVVLINDRGPFIKGRIIDLSQAAAEKLDLKEDGVAPCRVEVLAYPLNSDDQPAHQTSTAAASSGED